MCVFVCCKNLLIQRTRNRERADSEARGVLAPTFFTNWLTLYLHILTAGVLRRGGQLLLRAAQWHLPHLPSLFGFVGLGGWRAHRLRLVWAKRVVPQHALHFLPLGLADSWTGVQVVLRPPHHIPTYPQVSSSQVPRPVTQNGTTVWRWGAVVSSVASEARTHWPWWGPVNGVGALSHHRRPALSEKLTRQSDGAGLILLRVGQGDVAVATFVP